MDTRSYRIVCPSLLLVVRYYSNFLVSKTEARGQYTSHKHKRKISGITGMSGKMSRMRIHLKLGALFGAEVLGYYCITIYIDIQGRVVETSFSTTSHRHWTIDSKYTTPVLHNVQILWDEQM